MAEVKRTRLQASRDVARAYRWALFKADRERCLELDAQAKEIGEGWIAPEHVPPDVAEATLSAILVPARLAEVTHVPVGTIYSWISRGLLEPVEQSEPGPAKYRARDVAVLEARRRVRHLDSA